VPNLLAKSTIFYLKNVEFQLKLQFNGTKMAMPHKYFAIYSSNNNLEAKTTESKDG
jgi:hypothetical protein